MLLVDPTGKQANSSVLLARNPNGDYNFTPAAAHILHLVSKVNEYQIRVATVRFVEANIWNGSIGTEGSSLTVGKDPNNAVITHYYKIFKDGKTRTRNKWWVFLSFFRKKCT